MLTPVGVHPGKSSLAEPTQRIFGARLGRPIATALLVLSLAWSMPVAVAAQSAAEQAIQHLVQTNQGLLDSGVDSIELVNVEWGPISIGGSSATATTFETWRTSYADGPTEFARDRNVYSLVQGADGAWKLTGDQHPDRRT